MLAGQLSEIDASEVLIWLRDSALKNKYPLVREAGDFCAHRFEREQGLSWQRAIDYCDMLAPMIAAMNGGDITEAWKTNFKARVRIVPREILDLINIKREDFLRRANKLIARISRMSEGGPVVAGPMSNKERWLSAFMSSIPPMLDTIKEPIFKWELFNILVDTGLIERSEDKLFEKISEYLIVFVMTRMHGAKMNGASLSCRLSMGTSTKMMNRLVVRMFVDENSKFYTLTTVFQTTCDVRLWADEVLHPKLVPPNRLQMPDWGVPLDFSTSRIIPFDGEELAQLGKRETLGAPEPPKVWIKDVDYNGPKEQFLPLLLQHFLPFGPPPKQ